ncbi:MAG: hypothetical protein ACX930_00485 [Erythrobacter sp.]
MTLGRSQLGSQDQVFLGSRLGQVLPRSRERSGQAQLSLDAFWLELVVDRALRTSEDETCACTGTSRAARPLKSANRASR